MATDNPVYADVPSVTGDDTVSDACESTLQEPQERIYEPQSAEDEIRVMSAPWLYSENARSYALELLDNPKTDLLYTIRVVCSDAPSPDSPAVTPDMATPPEFWSGMRNGNQLVLMGSAEAFKDEREDPIAYRDAVTPTLATIASTLLSESNASKLPLDFDMLSERPSDLRLIGAARSALNRQTYSESVSQFVAKRISIDPTAEPGKRWMYFVPNTPESLAELVGILKEMIVTRFASMDPNKSFLKDWPKHQYLVCGTLLYYRRPMSDVPDNTEFGLEPYGMMLQVMSSRRELRFSLAPPAPISTEADEPSE